MLQMLLLFAGTGNSSGSSSGSGGGVPSFVHALHYVVIMLRMPDFLGHVTVQLLADSDGYVEANMPEYVCPPHSTLLQWQCLPEARQQLHSTVMLVPWGRERVA